MSRIGKHPVAIPGGVEVQLSGRTLSAKGSLGTLRLVVSNEVDAAIADGAVTIAPKSETKQSRAMWGTTRALVNNMVTGVSKGFSITLEINGVGYRAAVQGNTLNLQLG
jgi:large subunit ribosomal protein L6